MSESGKLSVTGLKETKDALEALGTTVEKSIIRKGLRVGANLLKGSAQSEAPGRTGLLRSKIKVTTGKGGKGRISLNVGLRGRDFPGVSKGDETFYAAFVLYGYRVGNRKLGDARTEVGANNFLQRAADSSGQAAVDATTDKWKELIEEAAANKGQG